MSFMAKRRVDSSLNEPAAYINDKNSTSNPEISWPTTFQTTLSLVFLQTVLPLPSLLKLLPRRPIHPSHRRPQRPVHAFQLPSTFLPLYLPLFHLIVQKKLHQAHLLQTE